MGTPEELKTKHMSGEVLEVVCGAPQEALQVVESVPGVGEAAIFGATLHAIAEDAAAAEPAIRSALESAGLGSGAVRRIAPTLEDVFVYLIEAKDREEGAQREFRQ